MLRGWQHLSRPSSIGASRPADLTSANTWALAWDYDRYGNRLNQRLTGGTAAVTQPQLSIDSTTNRITTTGYSYLDSNTGTVAGNLTSDSIHSYTYDGENRLQTVDQSLAGYNYDQNGRRYFRNTTVNGVTTGTNYVFSGSNVIAEYVGGVLSKEYIYAGSGLLATLTTNGTTVTAAYSYPDHLSTRVETDASGNITRTYGHLPYGETWYETGTPDKWKFTSYERDSETNLDYAMARFYSSRLGRFMSPDPLGQGYPYVGNDPINGVDPLGLFHCPSHYANEDYTFWCAGDSGNGPACPYCGSPVGGNPSYSGDTPGQIGTPMSANERAWLASGSIPWYSVTGGQLMLLIGTKMSFSPNPNYDPNATMSQNDPSSSPGTFIKDPVWWDTGSAVTEDPPIVRYVNYIFNRVWAGGVQFPLSQVSAGPAFQAAIIPDNPNLCGAVGLGIGERGATFGPLWGNQASQTSQKELFRGSSITIDLQLTPWLGGQLITDGTRWMWGPTFGTSGVSAQYTYGGCLK